MEKDAFEQEEEKFGEEETQQPVDKIPKTKEVKEVQEVPENKYEPFYVEAKIGIMNTITGEVEQEGFTNITDAQSQAKILNMLDRIAVVTGVQ